MKRKINAVAFDKQMAEQVIADDSLLEIQANAAGTESVWAKVPFNLDEGDDYLARLSACSTGEEMALLMLSFYPGASADEQWEKWTAAGLDAKLLTNIVGAARSEAEERAKNFRYRG